ncbi:MAG: hypothetical protein JOZ38_12050 [Candidatus Eremiobacteraeota bacterium]|nr:hypothetical protein [Candidatus Eremiobacteraeota bacterium]
MDATSLSITVSIATLVVVAVASFAAIVQLRHLRASNQLNALLEIMNQWNIPVVQSALAELRTLPHKLNDPDFAEILHSPGPVSRAAHPEFLALDLYEQIGTFTKHGLIDENILLDILSAQIRSAWDFAQGAIAAIRTVRGPSAFENFEYLAMRAQHWERAHPNGTYPRGLPRVGEGR